MARGTISLTWGWLIVGFFILCVGATMAEICSAYPTSGGLFFWSAQLAACPKWKPFASWITGWFNVFGQWAVTCGTKFALPAASASGGVAVDRWGEWGRVCSDQESDGGRSRCACGVTRAPQLFARAFLFIILIPLVAMERNSASFMFTSFNVNSDLGLPSKPYVFLIGLTASQYALSGFDASAHLTEETKSSDRNGKYGILGSIIISLVVGYAYILALCFVAVNPAALLDSGNEAGGYAVAQICYQLFKDRYGSGTGGILCLGVIVVAIYFCCMALVLSNSSMVRILKRWSTPIFETLTQGESAWRASQCSVAFCCHRFIMVLPALGSLVALQATLSATTNALYISYVLPTLFRITVARNTFEPGPVNLGPRWVSLTVS